MDKNIKNDIDRLKGLQESYFQKYNQYFETNGKIPKDIPDEGTNAQITSLSRFRGNLDTGATDIDFIPTAKDFQIDIKQVIFVNSKEGGYKEGKEKRAYIITVTRKKTGDIIEKYISYGGDNSVINIIKGEL